MLGFLAGKAPVPQESIKLLGATLADDPETLNNRANSYLAEGKIQAAIDCFRRVAELRPSQHKRISISAQRRNGWGTSKLRPIPIGARSTLQPDSPDLHCHLARVLLQSGALQPAAELYQRALALDPKRYEIYNDLGVVLTNLGNFGAAIEAFRRSLRLNPRSAKTIASLGHLFECKGDLISAADAYRDAIKLDPQLVRRLC